MHRCIEDMNRGLRPGNQRVTTHRATDGADGAEIDVPVIATTSLDDLDGPKTVIAKFCPFCGQRLRGDRVDRVKEDT